MDQDAAFVRDLLTKIMMYLIGSLSLIIGTLETWRVTHSWESTCIAAVLVLSFYFIIWYGINQAQNRPRRKTQKHKTLSVSVETERLIDPMEMDRYDWDAEAARSARME